MPYRTILLHLNDKRRAENLLEPTIELATRFNSHLIGLHAYAQMPAPPIAIPYATKMLASVVATEHENSEELAAIFAQMTEKRAFVAEWQALKVPHLNLANAVMERGRTVDLIVAGQSDPSWDLSPLLDFPELLALESGRPVLVVPYVGQYPAIGRRVVIAWKAGRESARAVFDALPFLRAAESVKILEVKAHPSQEGTLAPDTSIAVSLARHGIKPTIHTSIASDISVGDEILSRLADYDADLLVMGAYGHGRLRELVLGGVTRHIARHMTVPTLLSH